MSLAFSFACVSGKAADEPIPAAQEGDVTFVSYNLKNWLSMDRARGPITLRNAPKPEKEKTALIKNLVALKPDVLGVCEIGSDADFADLKKRLSEAGLDYAHTERAHGGDPTRSLGLLSRFPITARNSQTSLTYKIGETTFPVQRGFLDVTIDAGKGFTFRAIGVHLKSMRTVPEADQAMMRRNEADLLRAHITSILTADPNTKLLAYGDFNDHAKQPPIDAIHGDTDNTALAMRDVFLKDHRGEVWTHFYDWEDSYSRLDYFFVSPALHPHVKARSSFIYGPEDFNLASDHRPIVLRLSPETTRKTTRSKTKSKSE